MISETKQAPAVPAMHMFEVRHLLSSDGVAIVDALVDNPH